MNRPVRKLVGLGKLVLVGWAAYHIGHACGRKDARQSESLFDTRSQIEELYHRPMQDDYKVACYDQFRKGV